MDIASLTNTLDTSALVAWFALLILVFAVFLGIGIHQNRRSESQRRAAAEPQTSKPPRRSRSPAHRKEYT